MYDERRDLYFEIQPERDFALDVYYHTPTPTSATATTSLPRRQ
jgi:hypothetical protein